MKKYRIVLAALCGCIVYALGAMSRVAVPGMAFEALREGYGLTAAQIALLPSVGVLGCLCSIGIAGVLVDRFGWARLLLVGAFVQALGYWPVHESSDLALMLAGEFVNGIGRTTVYLAILKLFDVSFPRRRFAALIGIFYFFSYGGTLCASTVFPWLVQRLGSWQLAARAINVGTSVAGVLIAGLVLGQGASRSHETRSAFPWRDLRAFRKPEAWTALLVAGLGIAVYWSFLTVCGAPFARAIGHPEYVSQMNTIVALEMIFMGSASLFLGNARRPFFLFSAASIASAFVALLLGYVHAGYILLGCGYGMTVVLLAGVKERVPIAFAASAIGFTNFFANIVQVATNQASGVLMKEDDYTRIFTLFLCIACAAFVSSLFVAVRRGESNIDSRGGSPHDPPRDR